MKFIICTFLIFTCGFANANNVDYQTSLNQFYELVKKLEVNKELPTLNTPEGKRILNELTNPELIKQLSKDSLNGQMSIVEYNAQIFTDYVYFNPDKKPHLNFNDITRNIKQFEPELILLNCFNIKYFASLVPIVNDFYTALPDAEKTDIRLSGIKMMQLGILQYYNGVFMWMSESNLLSEHSQYELITVIEQATKNFAAILSKEKKNEIIVLAKTTITKLPKYKSQLNHIIDMIEDSSCNYLCQVTSQ